MHVKIEESSSSTIVSRQEWKLRDALSNLRTYAFAIRSVGSIPAGGPIVDRDIARD